MWPSRRPSMIWNAFLAAILGTELARFCQLSQSYDEVVECFAWLLCSPSKGPSLHRFVNLSFDVTCHGVYDVPGVTSLALCCSYSEVVNDHQCLAR